MRQNVARRCAARVRGVGVGEQGQGCSRGGQGARGRDRGNQSARDTHLVSPRIIVGAVRAGPLDEAIRQKLGAAEAKHLLHHVLQDVALGLIGGKDALSNDCLRPCRRARRLRTTSAAKVIKGDVKPGVDGAVLHVVAVADLASGTALLRGLGLVRRAVLIRAAHVHAVHAALAAETSVHIRRQHAADEVAQVRHVVDVWQRRRDEHVALALHRQHLAARRRPPLAWRLGHRGRHVLWFCRGCHRGGACADALGRGYAGMRGRRRLGRRDRAGRGRGGWWSSGSGTYSALSSRRGKWQLCARSVDAQAPTQLVHEKLLRHDGSCLLCSPSAARPASLPAGQRVPRPKKNYRKCRPPGGGGGRLQSTDCLHNGEGHTGRGLL